MESISGLAGSLISGLGQASLVVILYTMVSRLSRRQFHSQLWLGLLFGIGSAASMLHPMEFAPGVAVDPRTVMLTLAGPFGGPVASVIAVIIAALMRIHIGGIGMIGGIIGIALSGAAGLIHRAIFHGRTDFKALAVLGVMSAAFLFGLVALPKDVALAVLVQTGPGLVLTNFVGIVAIGTVLAYEMRFQDSYATMKTAVDRDPLTGLYNRRAMDDIEARVKRNAADHGEAYAVILFDIDRFKAINDNFGHDAGDVVLSQIAKIVASSVRRSDFAIRYGGEEILLVLRGALMQEAFALAEKVRTTVNTSRISVDGQTLKMTISAGVSALEPGETSLAPALKRADEALYFAKGNGRDRTERSDRLYEAPSASPESASGLTT